MKAYIVTPLYQAPGGPGTSPNNVVVGVGVGIRIEPIATSAGVATFPGNRHILLDGAGEVNCAFSGSSWIPQRFSSFQFGIEMAGANASDAWLVYVAEEGDDPSTYGGVGIPWSATYTYNPVTQLYSGPVPATSPVVVSGNVNATIVGTPNVAITSSVVIETVPDPADNIKQTSGSVTTTTPINVTSALQGGSGVCTSIIISNTSAAGILTFSIGASGNPGVQVGPNTTSVIPGIAIGTIAVWVEASGSTLNYAITALYV